MSQAVDHNTDPFDKIAALFTWWGLPDDAISGGMSSRLTRLQGLFGDLQTICADAGSEQTEALLASNDRILRSFQDLLQCRRPGDFIAAEGVVLEMVLDEASRRMHAWADLTRRVHECCADAVRENERELPVAKLDDTAPPAPAAKGGSKQQV